MIIEGQIVSEVGDRVWTYVTLKQSGDWPFTMAGYIGHRVDLSDLDEPFLSAVKETLAKRHDAPHLQTKT